MILPPQIRARFRFAGDLARAAEVARVLAKYGLAGWLGNVEWEPIQRAFRSASGESLSKLSLIERIRLVLIELGTTFIKLGQMLSTRPDVVGVELATELSKLQAGTPPDPPDVALAVLSAELGRPVEECFAEFDGVALASASIGQVHQARLLTGRRVVVKLQHPGIEGVIRRDLDILGFLADIAERNEHLRRYQPAQLIRDFSRTTLNELDFRRELRNLQVFRRNFANDPTVAFPRPYPEYTSGRVLTMEYLEGIPVSDARRLAESRVDRAETARHGANVFVQMIFRDGFYHADPHPGNFLLLPDGQVGLLDAGMVGRIDSLFKKQIEDMLLSAADQDSDRLTDAVLQLCGTPRDLDRAALAAELTELFQEYGTQSVGQFDMSGALADVSTIMHRFHLVLPSRLSMLIKCLALLEGTGRLLNPGFGLAELLEPWRKRFLRRQFSPQVQLRNLQRAYGDWQRLAEVLPKSLTQLVSRIDRGKFSLRLEHRHLKSLANRINIGLFVAALLLGSTILMAWQAPPTVGRVSIIGLAGYLACLGCGARWMWINRDGAVEQKEGDWE